MIVHDSEPFRMTCSRRLNIITFSIKTIFQHFLLKISPWNILVVLFSASVRSYHFWLHSQLILDFFHILFNHWKSLILGLHKINFTVLAMHISECDKVSGLPNRLYWNWSTYIGNHTIHHSCGRSALLWKLTRILSQKSTPLSFNSFTVSKIINTWFCKSPPLTKRPYLTLLRYLGPITDR